MKRSTGVLVGLALVGCVVATASYVSSLEATIARLSAENAEPKPAPRPAPATACFAPRPAAYVAAASTKSFEELLAAVSDATSPATKAEAIRALGRDGGLEGVAALDDLLASQDASAATVAAEALGAQATDDGLSVLARALDEGQYERQVAAAHGLAFRGDQAAVLVLTTFIDQRTSAGDVGPAIAGLGELGSEEAVSVLTDMVYFGQAAVCTSATEALASSALGVGALVDAAERGVERRVRVAAMRGLRRAADTRADEALLRWVNDPDHAVRLAVLDALGGRRSPRTLGPLLAVARTEDDPEQPAATAALGARNDEAALDALRELLHQVRPVHVENVVNALSFMTVAGSCDALVDAFTLGTDASRYSALQTVSQRCPERITIRDPRTADGFTASIIIRALGNLRTEDARRQLAALAFAEQLSVALAAIEAIGSLDMDAALPILRSVIARSVPSRATAAVTALGGVSELPVDDRERIAGQIRAGRWPIEDLPSGWDEDAGLVKSVLALGTSAPLLATRSAAMNALAWSGSPETRDIVRALARDKADPYGLRRPSEMRLAMAGDTETLVELRRRAASGDSDALDNLAAASDPSVMSLALPLLSAKDPNVATSAINSLGVARAPPQVTAALEALARTGSDAAATAASALAVIGTDESRRAALALATSGTPAVREVAIRTINCETAPSAALPVLRDALRSNEAGLVGAAFDTVIAFPGGRDEVERAFVSARDPDRRRQLAELIRNACPEQYERHQAEIDTLAPIVEATPTGEEATPPEATPPEATPPAEKDE